MGELWNSVRMSYLTWLFLVDETCERNEEGEEVTEIHREGCRSRQGHQVASIASVS